jgi:prevent-host-death family protein
MSAIREIGAFEAKTHFSELIEAAKGGTEVIVTRRGEPIARIVPIEVRRDEVFALIAEFDTIRSSARPGPSVRELKEEGRR